MLNPTTIDKPPKKRIPRPFLKWAGGKTQLLPELMQRLPHASGQYLEPFLGGGALFFQLSPRKAIISDLNQELIDCYRVVRDQPDALINILETYKYDKDFYYAMRARNPMNLDPVARAARTIYLNKTGYNGLYRVNGKGIFNVPFGRYVNPRICDAPNLLGCSAVLKQVELECRPFDAVIHHAKPGDFIYFDPPYIPRSNTAYFTAYEKHGFGMSNQEKLAEVFTELDRMGVYVMLSNACVPWIKKAYARFNIHRVKAARHVNRDASKRGAVSEVIITNY